MSIDNTHKKVSVILPNYNHAPYLKLRIDSILEQTYPNLELIILDDFSTDNSKEIIEKYRNNARVKLIEYNEKNSGSTFVQWRKGIEIAEGDYIWIAESDDYAEIHFLEKTVVQLEETGASHCFSMSYYIDENNEITKEKEEVIEDKLTSDFYDFTSNIMLYGCLIYNASMVIFRKDVVKDLDWDLISSFKLCGDWLFWNMTILNGKSCVTEVKERLNYHRRHSSNTSSRKEVEGYTCLEGYTVSKKTFERLGLKNNREFYIRWYNKWQIYKHEYSFSGETNKNILKMFLKKQPRIAFYELKRLLARMLGLKATVYIDPVNR